MVLGVGQLSVGGDSILPSCSVALSGVEGEEGEGGGVAEVDGLVVEVDTVV